MAFHSTLYKYFGKVANFYSDLEREFGFVVAEFCPSTDFFSALMILSDEMFLNSLCDGTSSQLHTLKLQIISNW